MRAWFFGALLATALSGCGLITANRPDVQQGNVLTADDLEQLEEGLSRGEVRERLGSPVLQNRMHPDRWDYVYYRTEGGMEVGDTERLTLFFEGDRLVRMVNEYEPPDPEPLAPESGAPAPGGAQPSAPPGGPSDGPPLPGPGGPRTPMP